MAAADLPLLSDPDGIAFLQSRGLWHSTADRFGLGVTAKAYPKRLAIPYTDGLYRTRYVRTRRLFEWDTGPKYASPKNAPPHLFAVRAVEAERVVICEGEIDTMTVWQCGGRAVGLPGAGTWAPEWSLLFRNAFVILALDEDDAGRKGQRRIERDLARWGIDCERAELPNGMDVNDLYLEGGRDALMKAGVL